MKRGTRLPSLGNGKGRPCPIFGPASSFQTRSRSYGVQDSLQNLGARWSPRVGLVEHGHLPLTSGGMSLGTAVVTLRKQGNRQ